MNDSAIIVAIRNRVADLVDLLTKADAILDAGKPLSAFPVARLGLAVDSATVEIEGHVELLQAPVSRPA